MYSPSFRTQALPTQGQNWSDRSKLTHLTHFVHTLRTRSQNCGSSSWAEIYRRISRIYLVLALRLLTPGVDPDHCRRQATTRSTLKLNTRNEKSPKRNTTTNDVELVKSELNTTPVVKGNSPQMFGQEGLSSCCSKWFFCPHIADEVGKSRLMHSQQMRLLLSF